MKNEITTCQICGRDIKAKTGVIAHHGYQRPNRGSGWQTASCRGAKGLPYEVSCDLLPPTIEYIKMYIANQKKHLKDFTENPPEELSFMSFGGKNKKTIRPEKYKYNEERGAYPAFSYESEHHYTIYQIKGDIKASGYDLDFMEKRLKQWVAPK